MTFCAKFGFFSQINLHPYQMRGINRCHFQSILWVLILNFLPLWNEIMNYRAIFLFDIVISFFATNELSFIKNHAYAFTLLGQNNFGTKFLSHLTVNMIYIARSLLFFPLLVYAYIFILSMKVAFILKKEILSGKLKAQWFLLFSIFVLS